MRTANAAAVGTISRNISNRFGPTSTFKLVTPVRLAPGWFRLATSPTAIGSAPISKTIGTVVVAEFAARAAGAPPGATITVRPDRHLGYRRTNRAEPISALPTEAKRPSPAG